ncbi:MAG: HupE/UreJ family protein [Pseudomonadales bacterium]
MPLPANRKVVFFLSRPRDIVLYVSLFTLGHSITLLLGVFAGWQVNAYLIDAVIGFSVVYKAFENMGGLEKLGRFKLDTRTAVFIFGLFHGLGLATKLQNLTLTEEGLVTNMLSFNAGVELGQVAALSAVLLLLVRWRDGNRFPSQAFLANAVLMTCGFILAGFQFTGYLVDL